MKSKKVLITSALLYANGPLHFGHLAGAFIPADCYARYQRLKGKDVLYVSGSDEYGIAITLSAEMQGRSYQEHVDFFHQKNQKLLEQMGISFDYYGRTTDKIHSEDTVAFFQDLLENGFLQEKKENHLFSPEENRFLSDRYVIGICPKCAYEKARGDECPECGASFEAVELKNPRSKTKNTSLILKPSTHWYMRFDLFKDKLIEWIEKKNWKDNVVSFAKNYIEDLKPRSITRDSSWGISVPLEKAKNKVFYVWFDAPIGYISIGKKWAIEKKDPDRWKKYWLDSDTMLVHFIGKDNIPFHTVFFPAMIMGQKTSFKLADQVPANEFLLLEGKQFSKSEGWYIDLEEFLRSYTVDQLRYYLIANAPENADANFSWKQFQIKCNADLLGKLGNLVHRTLLFTHNNFAGKIPEKGELDCIDERFLQKNHEIYEQICLYYEQFSLRKVASSIMELCQVANAYFDQKMPWKLIKVQDKMQEAKTAIYLILESIKNLALVSSPVIPEISQKIYSFLGYTKTLSKQNWEVVMNESIKEGTPLIKPEILFSKIEDETIEKEINKLGKESLEKTFEPVKENISFKDFTKLDLRVGQILACEKIVKSKKLLKLTIDLGFEKRTIVSGISEYFQPEELIGKKVPVVVNIPIAKIMGVESKGMVLAASFQKALELPWIDKLPPGAIIS